MLGTRSVTFSRAAVAASLITLVSALGWGRTIDRDGQQAVHGHIAYELFTRGSAKTLTESWIAYSSLHSSERRLLTPRPRPGEGRIDFKPVWSPDGQQLAFLRTWTRSTFVEIYVMNVDGAGLHRLFRAPKHGAAGFTLLWAPDGASLLLDRGLGYLGRGRIATHLPFLLIDANSGRQVARHMAVRQPRKLSLFLTALDISPDGTELLSLIYRCADCGEPNVVSSLLGVSHLRRSESRVIAEIAPAEDAGRGSIGMWAPVGHRIAYLNGGALTIASASTRRRFRIDLGGSDIDSGDDPSNLFWSPSGNEIFLGGRTLRAVDLQSRRVRTVARIVRGQPFDYFFVPILGMDADGRHIATGHESGRAYIIDLVATNGTTIGRRRLSPPSRKTGIGDVSVTLTER
jgi:hypothetical protein